MTQSEGPWRAGDLVNLASLQVVAASLLFAGWWVVHNTVELPRSVLGMNLAVAGVIVALAGNSVWLLGGAREVGRLRQEVLRTAPAATAPAAPAGSPDVAGFRAADGMRHYHRPGCLLLAGKEVPEAPLAAHLSAGRIACAVCAPGAAR